MTEAEKIGLLANLPRLQAQDTIHRGDFDPTNYKHVYGLYLMAFGSEQMAQRAKSMAAEAYADAKMREAKHNVQKI